MAAVRNTARLVLCVLAMGSAQGEGIALRSGKGSENLIWPYVVPLQREQVPVVRNKVTVSYKTTFSGDIALGSDGQQFRVVFDTGSGHVVLPSVDCLSESCRLHKRYNISTSSSSVAINADGQPVPPDELCDQVTVGYGTGKITGEFVKDTLCLGGGTQLAPQGSGGDMLANRPCITASVVTAVEMSAQPFNSFKFDGIFGLGLDSLAVAAEFSILNRLSEQAPSAHPSFGVFLSDGDGPEDSEISLGGHNPARSLTPLAWAPVESPQLGYWQVRIKAVKVDGVVQDICKDGSCRGVLDTGTSHIGVPAANLGDFNRMLSTAAGDTSDCRGVEGINMEFELEGVALKLKPENYMRRLPLAAGTTVGSSNPVATPETQPTALVPAPNGVDGAALTASKGTCTPRLMPVNLPAPMGPKLFILGEPVLNRYYTVYNWKEKQIGFGLAGNAANRKDLTSGNDDEVFLMQVTFSINFRIGRKAADVSKPKLRILQ